MNCCREHEPQNLDRFTAHHALIVGQILARVDFLDESIGRLSDEIDRVVLPFARQRDCSTRSPA